MQYGKCDTGKIAGAENAGVSPLDSQPEDKLKIKYKFAHRPISHINNSLTLFAFLVYLF